MMNYLIGQSKRYIILEFKNIVEIYNWTAVETPNVEKIFNVGENFRK